MKNSELGLGQMSSVSPGASGLSPRELAKTLAFVGAVVGVLLVFSIGVFNVPSTLGWLFEDQTSIQRRIVVALDRCKMKGAEAMRSSEVDEVAYSFLTTCMEEKGYAWTLGPGKCSAEFDGGPAEARCYREVR